MMPLPCCVQYAWKAHFASRFCGFWPVFFNDIFDCVCQPGECLL
jgi:hypothetical protein